MHGMGGSVASAEEQGLPEGTWAARPGPASLWAAWESATTSICICSAHEQQAMDGAQALPHNPHSKPCVPTTMLGSVSAGLDPGKG